ncbi:PD-(D/E)XK nuclease family protein [Noviherbaspirillum sp. CPCC 100848]|uniref:PD-(D/E)XK nuclease family protein n=1 Tax=Noviherbaspirillum album TaxID=3080276 RepID=A0ABU6J5U8_9BURK|nr:PD-(D/E)XK nuclease family protein [Noviherbaspirillum sp. CPCC 100848]MEC4718720.1 PD-(D/E)XK nuclease family protein [Noviherbaspirillum sp. CPCC 100848]
MPIMLYPPLPVPPSSDCWSRIASALVEHDIVRNAGHAGEGAGQLSGIRVVVPRPEHAQMLKAALAAHLGRSFIAPRITTPDAWLAQSLQPSFGGGRRQAGPSTMRIERLMALYAQMRAHPWLKKLFHAKRNTDLLPVAHSLLNLCDELSEAMLPLMRVDADAAATQWRTVLQQLPLPAQGILSDEARLVWTLWQGQFDGDDPAAIRLARLRRLAAAADAPLVWIGNGQPQPLHDAFLEAYARRCPVLSVVPEWQPRSLASAYAAAWPEVLDENEGEHGAATASADANAGMDPSAAVFLHAARSLEDEAQHAAQTVLKWLSEGRKRIAVIAQDPAAARRLRALLARAGIVVADQTERKLSATRPAAMLAALLDVVATRAGTPALLDLLKCPGLCEDLPGKAECVMQIELALRRANVPGGWNPVLAAVARESGAPGARMLLLRIAGQAWRFSGRKSLNGWARLTESALRELGLRGGMEAAQALEARKAGRADGQLLALLDGLAYQGGSDRTKFGFAEWRAMLGTQFESTSCIEDDGDCCVVMLPLSGTPLRRFDAVVMLGADAAHLPLLAERAPAFAGHVRRELGLSSREVRQRMQLREFAELLNANPEVVLCWQAVRDGEPNAASPWIERLRLVLEQNGRSGLPAHHVAFQERRLRASPPRKPSPSAPELLPGVLSATAYNSLVACPYQFFATRMLGLASLEELTELPEKRDYGGWLHAILKAYHESIRDNPVDIAVRERLLRDITDQVFRDALVPGAAAPGALVLGYYARWQKAIPAYLEWADEREASGWRFALGEQMLERVLEWEGGQILLRGRVDRIDEHPDGSRAILDYKAQGVQALRETLREGDDHRLAFCAVLSEAPVSSGHLVALEPSRNRTGDAAAEHFIEWQEQLERRIVSSLQAIGAGAPLPATGVERICIHCDVRGLCRKGTW